MKNNKKIKENSNYTSFSMKKFKYKQQKLNLKAKGKVKD